MILEKLAKDTQNLARVKQAGMGDLLGQAVGGAQRFYEDAKEDLGKAKDRAGAWADDKIRKGKAWAGEKYDQAARGIDKGKAWAEEKYNQGIEGINAGPWDRNSNFRKKSLISITLRCAALCLTSLELWIRLLQNKRQPRESKNFSENRACRKI